MRHGTRAAIPFSAEAVARGPRILGTRSADA